MTLIDNKKRTTVISISLILIFLTMVIIANNYHINNNQYLNQSQVCIKDNCFSVKLAITESERQKGLMFVQELNDSEGMLFIFKEEAIHPFWMKNTLIPLDIIWINQDKEVVFIERNALPCNETCNNIIPNASSIYTLEINANLTDKYNISLGDKLIFHNT